MFRVLEYVLIFEDRQTSATLILRVALVMRGLSLSDYATADSRSDARTRRRCAARVPFCARGRVLPNSPVRFRTFGRS